MKKMMLIVALISMSCILTKAPLREVLPPADTFFEIIDMPEVVSVGDEVDFTTKTEPGNMCFGVIWYISNQNNLVDHELEVITVGDNGMCTWKWIVPDDADNGKVNIEWYIIKNGEYASFPTQYFCISECPKD